MSFSRKVFFILCAFTFSFAELASAKNVLQPVFGLGGAALRAGVDFEIKDKSLGGYGFYGRLYTENEDTGENGALAFGGFVRPHFRKGAWDFFATFGPGVIQVEGINGADDETAIGAYWGIGLNLLTKHSITFGVEAAKLYNFLNSDLRTNIKDDLMFRINIPI